MSESKRYRTYCAYCGAFFTWSGRGRQPIFCGGACRTASKRAADRDECCTPAECVAASTDHLDVVTAITEMRHSGYCTDRRMRIQLAGTGA